MPAAPTLPPASLAGPEAQGQAPPRKHRSLNMSREELQQKLSPEQHYEQGLKLLRNGSNERALKAFELALEGDSQDVRFRTHLAWTQFLVSPNTQWRQCKEVLTECVKSQEEQERPLLEPYLFLARLCKRREDHQTALKLFRKVLRIDPGNIEAQREQRLSQMRKTGESGPTDGSFFGKLFQKKKP